MMVRQLACVILQKIKKYGQQKYLATGVKKDSAKKISQ